MDEEAFLKTIAEHPADDSPREVFADWLEEQGACDRAEFIRVQIELQQRALSTERWRALREREAELLTLHRQEWERPLRELGATHIEFERGFPGKVAIKADKLIRWNDECTKCGALAGCSTLAINQINVHNVSAVANCPALAHIPNLDLANQHLGDAVVVALIRSPYLGHLRSLNLAANDLTDVTVEAIAKAGNLSDLTQLGLWGNRIGDRGARALAGSPFPQLSHLSLWHNQITEAGARALLVSPNLPNLETISLGYNQIGERMLDEIQERVAARRTSRQPKGISV